MPQKMLYYVGRYAIELVSHILLDMNILYHEELPAGPKLIAPNHPTTVDPFIITVVAPEPVHILITESAFKAPLLGKYLRSAGHVPVLVENGRAAFEAGKHLLEEGKTVSIFPEGALSPLDGIARPHTGAVRLALITGVPIIPVGIGLDKSRIRELDTGIENHEGGTEVARLYLGGPYFITVGVPMRLSGSAEDRAYVGAQTQRVMRHIIRLSRMSDLRIQGQELPKGAVETNMIGTLSIPFEIPS